MKARTSRWVQETGQEASKDGCNIKTRDENHQQNYRHIKSLYVRREGGKSKWHRGIHWICTGLYFTARVEHLGFVTVHTGQQ